MPENEAGLSLVTGSRHHHGPVTNYAGPRAGHPGGEREAILQVTGVCKRFGGLQALSGVSFTVRRGQIKAVIGPNGAGKTTLFNCIAGNLAPTAGAIAFAGQRIDGRPAHAIARLGLARTFQNIKLFPGMSAVETVMVGRHPKTRAGFLPCLFRLPWTRHEWRQSRERAMELLDLVEIADHAGKEATSLAFGQQRAVELARALATEPELLLLDEPAAGLNMYETAELGRLIRKIRDQGITILLVEHDMSLVMDISDEITVLNFGQKIADDTPAAIQEHPEVIAIYLGEDDAQGA